MELSLEEKQLVKILYYKGLNKMDTRGVMAILKHEGKIKEMLHFLLENRDATRTDIMMLTTGPKKMSDGTSLYDLR